MKEQILDKATEMFLTLGFKSVTMDDIAAEMAISKKTIYQHFATKPALIEAVAIGLFETISKGVDEISNLNKNAIEELFFVKDFLGKYLKDETASPIHQLQRYFPKVFQILHRKQFDKMLGCVTANLKKGIKEGLYRDDLDVSFVARLYYAGGSAIKSSDMFPSTLFSSKEIAEKYLDYHLRAIVSEKGSALLKNYHSNHNQPIINQ